MAFDPGCLLGFTYRAPVPSGFVDFLLACFPVALCCFPPVCGFVCCATPAVPSPTLVPSVAKASEEAKRLVLRSPATSSVLVRLLFTVHSPSCLPEQPAMPRFPLRAQAGVRVLRVTVSLALG